jgi:hypothetical protein
MDAQKRRAAVADCLRHTDQPLSAAALASRFSVSRQIIVGDIALLRAGGLEISATPRGYLLPREQGGVVHTVACIHSPQDMERELQIMVDNGCTVADVVVEHPIYGQLTGPLQLSSRYDIQQFLEKTATSDARPLADLTGGIHLHTLRCPDEVAWRRVVEQLGEAGFLYQQQ